MTGSSAAPPTPAACESLADKAEVLLNLHRRTQPLVLPNVWDAASAWLVAEAGFPAVATSSHAVAAVLGCRDDDSNDPDTVFRFLARIAAAVTCPVTADIEAGYRLAPTEVVTRLLDAGIVGCNLEDSDHHGDGVLVPAERQAEFLAAVRTAADDRGVHVVLNARVDTFIRHHGAAEERLAETVRRGRLYLDAGADCVFPIGLSDPEQIARLVAALPGPVNVLMHRGRSGIAALQALGVHRISLGSGIFTVGQDAVRPLLAELLPR